MLDAINLSKRYSQDALLNLNMKVDVGDIFCLLGANGARKNTTKNLFLNFTKPTSGKATINGTSRLDPKSTNEFTKLLQFHKEKRLYFYPKIFDTIAIAQEDWSSMNLSTIRDTRLRRVTHTISLILMIVLLIK